MPIEILLITILRALVEVAGMFLIGQGVLWLFGPRAREGNFVYDLFKKGTTPVTRVTRWITPRFIHDAHIGLVAFMLLLWLWFALAWVRRYLCVVQGVQCPG
jgi:hypothetical protein